MLSMVKKALPARQQYAHVLVCCIIAVVQQRCLHVPQNYLDAIG